MHVKVLLQNTLTLSHIHYCIMAWGEIQYKSLNKYNSNMETLSKIIKLLKLKDVLNLQE